MIPFQLSVVPLTEEIAYEYNIDGIHKDYIKKQQNNYYRSYLIANASRYELKRIRTFVKETGVFLSSILYRLVDYDNNTYYQDKARVISFDREDTVDAFDAMISNIPKRTQNLILSNDLYLDMVAHDPEDIWAATHGNNHRVFNLHANGSREVLFKKHVGNVISMSINPNEYTKLALKY